MLLGLANACCLQHRGFGFFRYGEPKHADPLSLVEPLQKNFDTALEPYGVAVRICGGGQLRERDEFGCPGLAGTLQVFGMSRTKRRAPGGMQTAIAWFGSASRKKSFTASHTRRYPTRGAAVGPEGM